HVPFITRRGHVSLAIRRRDLAGGPSRGSVEQVQEIRIHRGHPSFRACQKHITRRLSIGQGQSPRASGRWTIAAPMRTGAEYRSALRDGRRVVVVGEGWIDDVTHHPATCGMVDEYAAWYDLHCDSAWADVVLTPPDADGRRRPWGTVVPRSASDL